MITYIGEPFVINRNVFAKITNGAFTSATLYVPKGTKEKYEATEGWNEFKNIVELDGSGIDAPLMDNGQSTMESYYTLDGRKVEGAPTKNGVYITNGRKVVVK